MSCKPSPESSPIPIQNAWIDISPLKEPLIEVLPLVYTTEMLTGPLGELVPTEVRRRNVLLEEDIFWNNTYPLGLVRVGNAVLLDHRLQESLLPELLQQFQGNIVLLWNFMTDMGDLTHLPYAMPSIHALSAIDLKGKHVLDIGSGDGALSMVAYKKGASRVFSLELYPQAEEFYRQHISANGFDETSFSFLQGDVANPEAIAERLEGERIDIVISNIGPWYGDAHLQAISLLTHLPQVQTYIGGSFIKGHKDGDSQEAINLLRQIGFSRNFREVTARKVVQTFIVDRNNS